VTSTLLAIFIIGSQMFKTERNYAAHSRALTNTFLAYSLSPLYAPPTNNPRFETLTAATTETPVASGCDAVHSGRNLPTSQIPPHGESKLNCHACKFLSSIPCHILPEDGTLQNHWQILNLRVVKKLKQYGYWRIHCKMFTTSVTTCHTEVFNHSSSWHW